MTQDSAAESPHEAIAIWLTPHEIARVEEALEIARGRLAARKLPPTPPDILQALDLLAEKFAPPGAASLTHARGIYPWRTTPVGGSFFVPKAVAAGKGKLPPGFKNFTVTNATKAIPGSRWGVRRVTLDGVQGLRVTRKA